MTLVNLANSILLLTAIYHLIAGLFVLGPKAWLQNFGKNVYSLNIPNNYEPRYEATIKFLGLMALGLSAFVFLIFFQSDLENKIIGLVILSFLFLSRAAMRLLIKETLKDAYDLNFKRSFINILFNTTIAFISFVTAALIYWK
jgi:hypothetical protein